MKKKFLFSLIMCLCLVLFVGCAKVDASVTYVEQNGQALVVQALDVTLDRDVIENAGYDFDSTLSQLTAYAEQFMQEREQEYSWFLKEIVENETKYAKSINSYFYDAARTFTYLNNYRISETTKRTKQGEVVTGFRIQKEFGNIYAFMVFNGYNMFYTGCPQCKSEVSIDEELWAYNEGHYISNDYTCPSCQQLQTDYKHYFENRLVDIPLQGDLSVQNSSFVTEYLQECKTMFHNIESLKFRNGDRLIDRFAGVFRGGSKDFNLEDASLVYKFITPYKRVHSNGQVSKQDGMYVHTWNITDPDVSIFISRKTTNSTMWYVVSLASAIGFVVVYFAIRITVKAVKAHSLNKPKIEKKPEVITKNTNQLTKSTPKTIKTPQSKRLKQKTEEAKHNNLIDIIKR